MSDARRAIRHVAAGGGRALEVGTDLVTIKAGQGDGLGSLVLELLCPPGGGPPPHSDPSEELIYVLEGEFEFSSVGPDGTATHRGSAGDTVAVPKRVAHTFRNVGAANGRLLVFFRDNAHMQPFFEEMGDVVTAPEGWAPSGPPDMERAMAAAKRHGVEPVGPPPGAS